MKPPKLLGSVAPFIAAIAVIITAAILVVAIYFTLLDLQWIAFLAGSLIAAILAMVSRATRAEYAAVNLGARFAVAEDKLAKESDVRSGLEGMLDRANTRLRFADDLLPVMVSFIDKEGICRYHNHAYRRWLDLPAHRIDGQHLRNVLGKNVFAQIESDLARACSGETVRYQRTQKMANGSIYRLDVQLLPVFDAQHMASGYYAVISDITERHDLQAAIVGAPVQRIESGPDAGAGTTPAAPQLEQAQYDESVAQQATGLTNVRERILSAFERNEFTLFRQFITPLDPASGRPRHHEVLIRLIEEESNLIPPGAFFPLAEEMGMLPQLDRWVVAHLLEYLADNSEAGGGQGPGIHFVNITTATLSDPDFPDYVAQQLGKTGVPGNSLCFEVMAGDVDSNRADAEAFIKSAKQAGCRIALGGFGRGRASVEILKSLPVDFLKIDGSVILQMRKDTVAAGKVVTINRVAKVIGIATIAEMVEDEATAARLREISVDYAQGFGISQPRPLRESAQ